MIEAVAAFVVPLVMCIVGVFSLFGKRPYFDHFKDGAVDGLKTAVGLLPTLVLLLVGVKMLNASGIPQAISELVSPAAEAVGVPEGLLPLLLTRPVSGSASTAMYSEILSKYGADSFTAACASVIMGSSDTMIYVLGVYFSSVGIKKSGYALPCAIAVMLFCIFFSCFICRLWF